MALLAVFCFAAVLCSAAVRAAGAAGGEQKTVRGGIPIQKGLAEVEENGEVVGYTPDYLREAAQFTDWRYEFVGAEGDINTQNAVLRGADQSNAKLMQFCEMSGFTPELLECGDDAEALEAMHRGEADLYYGIDIALDTEDFKVVTSFMPQPFYFVATKGRKDIVNELSSAINLINESNPYFGTELHEKYFSRGSHKFALSKAEKAYIARAGTLRVAMMGGKAPIQYRDRKTGEIKGLSKDLLDEITALTGLRFEIIMPETYAEYVELLEQGKFDMAAGLVNDYKLTANSGFSLSVPYLRAPVSVAINSRVEPSALRGKRLAISDGLNYRGEYQGQASHYQTVEECLEAVHRGDVDYTYGNSYSVQYYLSNPEYKNILTISQSDDWTQEYCFGAAMPADVNLISILNKAIRAFPETEVIQNSLYANAYEPETVTLLSYILTNPLQAGMVLVMLVMVFTIALLLWTRHTERRNSRERRLENERYVQISELSNEYLYEYDAAQDRLKLPERCASFLGCGQVLEHVSRQEPDSGGESVFRYLAETTEGSREIHCQLPGGSMRWLRLISKCILDSAGKPIYSVGKLTDIQEEKERQAELEEKAQRDSLTGLYNTASVRQRVTELLRQEEARGALLVIDVDHFKSINDTFGHYAGDQVLRAIAEAIASSVRRDDVVGRIGGDEFIIFLRSAGSEALVAEKCGILRERVAEICEESGASVSIGAAFAEPDMSYTTLYQNADSAMYTVKKNGRNGCHIYSPEDQPDAEWCRK